MDATIPVERAIREARARLHVTEKRDGATFPTIKTQRRLAPTDAQIDALHARIARSEFWVSVKGGAWKNFPSREVARLLLLRLWNPSFGIRQLEAGVTFAPTPDTRVRKAISIGISRIDPPAGRS